MPSTIILNQWEVKMKGKKETVKIDLSFLDEPEEKIVYKKYTLRLEEDLGNEIEEISKKKGLCVSTVLQRMIKHLIRGERI